MIRLLQQDNRTIKIIFALIIGAAVISMVAYLIPGIGGDPTGSNDATVYATVREPGVFGRIFGESTPIKTMEVNQVAARQLQQQRLPDYLLPYMAQRAAQMLIQQTILKHEADRMGLQVTDEDLARELQTGEFSKYLFPNGKYIGDEAYINFVQAAFQTSRADFETRYKEQMELMRLQALITGGVYVSDSAVRDAYRIQGAKVKFDYVVISGDELGKTINPSDAELQSFFKQNQARYATAMPETRKIQYVSFGLSNLPGGKPQVTDAELQAYYNQHQDQFEVKPQVKVRHILITVPQGADAKTDAAAKSKAEDLLKQIKSGGNFADLATKNSDDPGSKTQGGELGWLDPGKTVPEFDKAAFSLSPGQTSDVIKTQFGYHILQVEDKKTAHKRTLEEVKGEILPVLEQQKAGAAEQNFANQLAAQAKQEGLEKAAASKGLHAVTTDFVPQNGVIASLADGAPLLTQAFTATKGAAPAAVSTSDGFAIFQVVDIKPAHAPEYDSYKANILIDYRAQQVPQLLNAQLNKLDDRAKVLNDLKKAAAEMNLPLKTSDFVGHDAQVPDLGAMTGPASVAFTLPKGGITGPLNLGDKGAVLSVLDKQEPTPEDIAKNFTQTREQLLNAQREEIFRIYVGTLTQKYQASGAVVLSKKPASAPGAPLGN